MSNTAIHTGAANPDLRTSDTSDATDVDLDIDTDIDKRNRREKLEPLRALKPYVLKHRGMLIAAPVCMAVLLKRHLDRVENNSREIP